MLYRHAGSLGRSSTSDFSQWTVRPFFCARTNRLSQHGVCRLSVQHSNGSGTRGAQSGSPSEADPSEWIAMERQTYRQTDNRQKCQTKQCQRPRSLTLHRRRGSPHSALPSSAPWPAALYAPWPAAQSSRRRSGVSSGRTRRCAGTCTATAALNSVRGVAEAGKRRAAHVAMHPMSRGGPSTTPDRPAPEARRELLMYRKGSIDSNCAWHRGIARVWDEARACVGRWRGHHSPPGSRSPAATWQRTAEGRGWRASVPLAP